MPDRRNVKQFNVYLPPEIIREVKHLAVDTERSLSAIVEQALSEYISCEVRRGRRDGD